MLVRVLVWLFLPLFALAVIDFSRRTQSTYQVSASPLPGIVFTGQFDRVHVGLGLLERGLISPLLISGANPGAGIPVSRFAEQFQLSPDLRFALAKGELVLFEDANNTYENASESSRWLANLPPHQPVVLITSQFHMPRASVALEQVIGQRRVLRYSVGTSNVEAFRGIAIEFAKYVWTYGGGMVMLKLIDKLAYDFPSGQLMNYRSAGEKMVHNKNRHGAKD